MALAVWLLSLLALIAPPSIFDDAEGLPPLGPTWHDRGAYWALLPLPEWVRRDFPEVRRLRKDWSIDPGPAICGIAYSPVATPWILKGKIVVFHTSAHPSFGTVCFVSEEWFHDAWNDGGPTMAFLHEYAHLLVPNEGHTLDFWEAHDALALEHGLTPVPVCDRVLYSGGDYTPPAECKVPRHANSGAAGAASPRKAGGDP